MSQVQNKQVINHKKITPKRGRGEGEGKQAYIHTSKHKPTQPRHENNFHNFFAQQDEHFFSSQTRTNVRKCNTSHAHLKQNCTNINETKRKETKRYKDSSHKKKMTANKSTLNNYAKRNERQTKQTNENCHDETKTKRINRTGNMEKSTQKNLLKSSKVRPVVLASVAPSIFSRPNCNHSCFRLLWLLLEASRSSQSLWERNENEPKRNKSE